MTTEDHTSRHALIGSGLVVLGAIGFSAKSILIKIAYAESAQVDAITLMTLRMLLALPFFLTVALWKREPKSRQSPRGDRLGLLLVGVLGYYLASLLDFKGLEHISAGLERLIVFLYPTMVVLLTALLYRRPIERAQRSALVLSYAGIALVYGANPQAAAPDVTLGSLLVLGSAVTFAIYLTGSDRLIPRFGSTRFTAYSMSVASLVTVFHFLVAEPLERLAVPMNVLMLAFALAVVSTVTPAFLMNAGIRRIGAAQAAIVATVGPVSTLIMAYFVLGETQGPLQVVGSVMVLAGVARMSLASRANQRLEHGR